MSHFLPPWFVLFWNYDCALFQDNEESGAEQLSWTSSFIECSKDLVISYTGTEPDTNISIIWTISNIRYANIACLICLRVPSIRKVLDITLKAKLAIDHIVRWMISIIPDNNTPTTASTKQPLSKDIQKQNLSSSFILSNFKSALRDTFVWHWMSFGKIVLM